MKARLFQQLVKEIQLCRDCPLGQDPGFKRHVIYRGDPDAKVWFVGEAPGKIEEREGVPFVGPAGKVFDQMVRGIGLKKFYVTNVVKARPRAPKGSGRENLPPTREIIDTCSKFLEREITLLRPRVICLLGGSAIKAFLKESQIRVGDYVGTSKNWTAPSGQQIKLFFMYHPSYLLHSKKRGEDFHEQTKRKMWVHALKFKQLIQEEIDE